VVRDHYGELLHTETIADGNVILKTEYYSNGIPRVQTPLCNRIVQGEKKFFLPSGEPEAIEQWANNQRNGITTLFQNGQKIAEIPYAHDQKEGIERRYRNESELVQEIHWKGDKRHGPSHYFVGDVIQTDWYFHGNQITRSAYEQMKRKELYSARSQ